MENYGVPVSIPINAQLHKAIFTALNLIGAPEGIAAHAQAHFARNGAIIGKELSSATHVAEASDGGWKPPRPVAGPAAAVEPFRWDAQDTIQLDASSRKTV